MKAKLVDSMRPGNWIYEIKFDGYRALALLGGGETPVLSRNQKDLGQKFPEVKDSIAALDVQDAIIDGEIVALDDKGRSSFQLLPLFYFPKSVRADPESLFFGPLELIS